MKLSSPTLDILKNFADINSNLVVGTGNVLSTISEAKNILATAKITETFDVPFGIYDLTEFISMFNLMDSPELEFESQSVTFSSGRVRASYRFADPSILTTPKTAINMPSADLNLTVTSAMLAQLRKAAGVLSHQIVSIRGDNGTVTLTTLDPKNSASNSFSIVVDEDNPQKGQFDLQFLISNIKVLPGDYTVDISKKLISHWKNTASDVKYYIALEKSSTFVG
jgi:hypothetical protein